MQAKSELTDFGKEIKKRLIDLGKTQNWLINEVREKTGLYFDTSYMYKICTGQLNGPNIAPVIREILDLPRSDKTNNHTSQSYCNGGP